MKQFINSSNMIKKWEAICITIEDTEIIKGERNIHLEKII